MQRGVLGRSGLAWRSSLGAVLPFVWPFLLLSLALTPLPWSVIVMFQPDLGSWLEVAAAIVFLKGLFELALIWRVCRHTPPRQMLQPV